MITRRKLLGGGMFAGILPLLGFKRESSFIHRALAHVADRVGLVDVSSFVFQRCTEFDSDGCESAVLTTITFRSPSACVPIIRHGAPVTNLIYKPSGDAQFQPLSSKMIYYSKV